MKSWYRRDAREVLNDAVTKGKGFEAIIPLKNGQTIPVKWNSNSDVRRFRDWMERLDAGEEVQIESWLQETLQTADLSTTVRLAINEARRDCVARTVGGLSVTKSVQSKVLGTTEALASIAVSHFQSATSGGTFRIGYLVPIENALIADTRGTEAAWTTHKIALGREVTGAPQSFSLKIQDCAKPAIVEYSIEEFTADGWKPRTGQVKFEEPVELGIPTVRADSAKIRTVSFTPKRIEFRLVQTHDDHDFWRYLSELMSVELLVQGHDIIARTHMSIDECDDKGNIQTPRSAMSRTEDTIVRTLPPGAKNPRITSPARDTIWKLSVGDPGHISQYWDLKPAEWRSQGRLPAELDRTTANGLIAKWHWRGSVDWSAWVTLGDVVVEYEESAP